jgi:hypothetical protein
MTCTINPGGPNERMITITSAGKSQKAQDDVIAVNNNCIVARTLSPAFVAKVKEITRSKVTVHVVNKAPNITFGQSEISGDDAWVDVGDVKNLTKAHFTAGTDADKNKVMQHILLEVFVHEVAHLAGKDDPGGSTTHDAMAHENAVLSEVLTASGEPLVQRKTYCRTVGGTNYVDWNVAGRPVTLDMTGFIQSGAGGGAQFVECAAVSVGGVAELPGTDDASALRSAARDPLGPGPIALIATAGGLVALGCGVWYARRRLAE